MSTQASNIHQKQNSFKRNAIVLKCISFVLHSFSTNFINTGFYVVKIGSFKIVALLTSIEFPMHWWPYCASVHTLCLKKKTKYNCSFLRRRNLQICTFSYRCQGVIGTNLQIIIYKNASKRRINATITHPNMHADADFMRD